MSAGHLGDEGVRDETGITHILLMLHSQDTEYHDYKSLRCIVT